MSDFIQSPAGDTQAAIDAGMALGAPRTVNNVPYAIVPAGCKVQYLSQLLDAPQRIEENVEALTLESFLAYLARFQDSRTVVFANATAKDRKSVV